MTQPSALSPQRAHLPTVVLVGRQNVGKSTLFNRLCGGRRAITSSVAGTTRDWQEGEAHWGKRTFLVVDTGGYAPGDEDVLVQVRGQVERWITQADVVLWVVDGGEGLTPADQSLGAWMRRKARRIIVAVNKADDAKRDVQAVDFYQMGFPDVLPVSAAHGRNMNRLLDAVEGAFPPAVPAAAEADAGVPRVALVGRPNVGKSSLLNAILGQDRMIVSAAPGTTRDVVDTFLEREEGRFLFMDTAGLRAKKSRADDLEGLTRLMTERALDRCEVALLLVDASEGLLDGDAAVGRLIDEKRRACVVGVNKWDKVADRPRTAQWYRDQAPEGMPFLAHAPVVFLSAKTGHHVPEVLQEVAKARAQFHRRFETEDLRAFFWSRVQDRPYSHRGRKLIFHGAEQVAAAPPVILLRTNMDEKDVHFSYQRHLENEFRRAHGLAGSPLVFRFKRGKK